MDERTLRDFLKHCSFAEFGTGERVHIGSRGSSEVPIFVVSEGCLAIHATTEYGKYEAIILALIMPTQLVGEFEFLGGKLPDRLEVIAMNETKVISFHPDPLRVLIKTFPAIAYNLAQAILTKQNISNFRLEAVSQSKGDKKLATLLLGFIRIPDWTPATYKDLQFKQAMPLSIMWSIDLISRYLSCDVRTARDGLLDLVEAKLINIQWFDDTLTSITDVSTEDIINLGKKNSRVNERTYFRLTIMRPNKLEEYCAD